MFLIALSQAQVDLLLLILRVVEGLQFNGGEVSNQVSELREYIEGEVGQP